MDEETNTSVQTPKATQPDLPTHARRIGRYTIPSGVVHLESKSAKPSPGKSQKKGIVHEDEDEETGSGPIFEPKQRPSKAPRGSSKRKDVEIGREDLLATAQEMVVPRSSCQEHNFDEAENSVQQPEGEMGTDPLDEVMPAKGRHNDYGGIAENSGAAQTNQPEFEDPLGEMLGTLSEGRGESGTERNDGASPSDAIGHQAGRSQPNQMEDEGPSHRVSQPETSDPLGEMLAGMNPSSTKGAGEAPSTSQPAGDEKLSSNPNPSQERSAHPGESQANTSNQGAASQKPSLKAKLADL